MLEDGFEEDLIWYKGHDKEDGIGFWATERVAQVGLHCDHPYDLPDERYHVKHIQQAPYVLTDLCLTRQPALGLTSG